MKKVIFGSIGIVMVLSSCSTMKSEKRNPASAMASSIPVGCSYRIGESEPTPVQFVSGNSNYAEFPVPTGVDPKNDYAYYRVDYQNYQGDVEVRLRTNFMLGPYSRPKNSQKAADVKTSGSDRACLTFNGGEYSQETNVCCRVTN